MQTGDGRGLQKLLEGGHEVRSVSTPGAAFEAGGEGAEAGHAQVGHCCGLPKAEPLRGRELPKGVVLRVQANVPLDACLQHQQRAHGALVGAVWRGSHAPGPPGLHEPWPEERRTMEPNKTNVGFRRISFRIS